eukprot:Rhum_TRINITY_DN14575_c9_g2::Rhum_TRINITY_DN14575_c9_g2_i1::g.99241::m.99241
MSTALPPESVKMFLPPSFSTVYSPLLMSRVISFDTEGDRFFFRVASRCSFASCRSNSWSLSSSLSSCPSAGLSRMSQASFRSTRFAGSVIFVRIVFAFRNAPCFARSMPCPFNTRPAHASASVRWLCATATTPSSFFASGRRPRFASRSASASARRTFSSRMVPAGAPCRAKTLFACAMSARRRRRSVQKASWTSSARSLMPWNFRSTPTCLIFSSSAKRLRSVTLYGRSMRSASCICASRYFSAAASACFSVSTSSSRSIFVSTSTSFATASRFRSTSNHDTPSLSSTSKASPTSCSAAAWCASSTFSAASASLASFCIDACSRSVRMCSSTSAFCSNALSRCTPMNPSCLSAHSTSPPGPAPSRSLRRASSASEPSSASSSSLSVPSLSVSGTRASASAAAAARASASSPAWRSSACAPRAAWCRCRRTFRTASFTAAS